MAVIDGSDGTPSGFVPTSHGVWGDSGSSGPFGPGGNGVIGSSKFYTGVAGFTLSPEPNAAGVFGGGQVGVAGGVTGSGTFPSRKVGVYGSGSNRANLGGIGVQGVSDTDAGVLGESASGAGVSGSSTSGPAVFGLTSSGSGVVGLSGSNTGVFGLSNGIGVFGLGGDVSGFFIGNVEITGSLTKGGGGFTIDHPVDPENRYLRHSFVESPDMKDLYDGIAICDDRGEAVVEFPNWFEPLNRDFRYQLTPIGAPGPNLFIASEIEGGHFTIGGGAHGLVVSWQVTGVRRDAWANANRLVVEEDKSGAARGYYLHPTEHGHSHERSVHRKHHAEASKQLERVSARPKTS